ncbi:CD276 antigen-like [Acipenser oxyrinchus oxyrinchus]|uniref:CD276 antigen-like n=1 Tax=Acipenser oxyrinchus oxyrinchus TaxID=40147 RepID=A0AAD8FQM0_ACIOX|nr:CD276 antigen-like [Acipenser oxyrinchus oxyrinchus]
MQTERAKRMDSAGEETSLNSPELPWNQLYLKRRTESRIQLRRRVCFTGPAAAAVTGVLAILILAAGSVSSDSEFVKVSRSVNCIEGQDCILSCSFNYTAGGWDEKSGVIWRRAEMDRIVHSYHDNTDQLADQLPQYVNRTSLFDSELQRGNASLLLRRVREEDAGEYGCSVYTPRLPGWGLTEVVMVLAQPTTAPAHVTVPSSVKCTEGQDCILSCSFNYTAGGWDEKSGVIWRRAEKGRIVHSNHDNTDQFADQLPQYVNRTSLFDSELQRGNASLLLRRVREEDAGEYRCFVSTPRLSGSGLTKVVVVPAQRHRWWVSGAVPLALCVIAGLCVCLWLYKKHACCCRKSNLASTPAQAVSLSDVIEEPSEV